MKGFSVLVVLLCASVPAVAADAITTVSLFQFFQRYQSFLDAHTEIQVSGVYARFAGIDLLYETASDAQTNSFAPAGRQRPISLWIKEASPALTKRFNQCLYAPDTVRTKPGDPLGTCDVTLTGHVESCVTWGIGQHGEALLDMRPTRLLSGPPPNSTILGCLVVD